jgi:hypothetical protein
MNNSHHWGCARPAQVRSRGARVLPREAFFNFSPKQKNAFSFLDICFLKINYLSPGLTPCCQATYPADLLQISARTPPDPLLICENRCPKCYSNVHFMP